MLKWSFKTQVHLLSATILKYHIRLIKSMVPNKRIPPYLLQKLGDQQAPKIVYLC